jgi:predicted enzyme related to lactoylglutathione lyase
MSPVDRTLSRVELCAPDFARVRRFYGAVFGWTFVEVGEEFCAFEAPTGLLGGFRREEPPAMGGTLLLVYVEDLDAAHRRVLAAGGDITQPIFDSPIGRRFQFLDPSGNELGVWSDRVPGGR